MPAAMLDSKYIIPGHYNTFPPIQQDAQAFKALAEARAAHSEVVVLEPNESFTF